MRPHPLHLAAAAAVALTALLAGMPAAHANALDHLRTTDDIGENKVPHVGTSHILVVPSRVGTTYPAAQLAELQAYFAPEGGPGTFRDFWRTTSNGRYDPIPTVADPVIYTDRCPIPGKTLQTCTFSLNDASLLFNRGLATAFEDVLSRVRDEQAVDLAEFDVNGATAGTPDGWLDGVIVDSDMYQGIGFPLAAFNNTATLSATAGGGPMLSCGMVAMVPPNNHEFGHLLGFIDLYGGPTVNDLMEDTSSTLGAFSRQQVGWGETVPVTAAGVFDLRPTLSGGQVLRFGTPPRYVMVENRGGAAHATYESTHAGIWVYSVDESQLPTTALGFVDILSGALNLPNQAPPYLFVALPVDCNPGTQQARGDCALTQEAEFRTLTHASGTDMGFTIRRGATGPDGTVTVYVAQGSTAPPWPPEGSTSSGGGASSGGNGSSGGTNGGGASSTGAASSSGGDASGGSNEDDSGAGCTGCSQAGPSAALWVGVGWWTRRRRHHQA